MGIREIVLTVFSLIAIAQTALADIRFVDKVSDSDLSPEGKTAERAAEWKHAESEHFIYHFTDEKESEAIFGTAEIYYSWVKQILSVSDDNWKKKAHIFIFADKDVWESFRGRAAGHLSGSAFTNGWELFLYKHPNFIASKKSLAHELTHVIAFRFLDGPIPLFINEGFAEYMAVKAAAMHSDGNEYRIRNMRLLSKEDFIGLNEISKLTQYPTKVDAFYVEGELFVRYLLMKHDPKKFYEFIRDLSKGQSFEKSLEKTYEADIEDISAAFHQFALTGK